MQVLVFKTNVKFKKQIRQVAPLLSNNPGICEWNFDLDDCDRILRVVSPRLRVQDVTQLLASAGYHCVELLG